jgi:opacity protein-like surface antigen
VWNNWLFYGTGGFAWSDDTFTCTQISAGATTPPLGDVRTNAPMRTGWTAGARGGIEWGFARNWTARLEYRISISATKPSASIRLTMFFVRSTKVGSTSIPCGSG